MKIRNGVPALLLFLCSSAGLAVPPDVRTIMPEDPEGLRFQQEWGFSDAVIAGDTIYLSGVVVGYRPGDANMEAAYERGFARIDGILKRAGSSWNDVIDITSYHTDLTTQMPAIVAVKNRYVKGSFPAWTAIGVSRLIPNNGITEIKIVARRTVAAQPKKR